MQDEEELPEGGDDESELFMAVVVRAGAALQALLAYAKVDSINNEAKVAQSFELLGEAMYEFWNR